MDVLLYMVAAAILIGMLFVCAFIWATKRGQYDDLDTPAHKILLDDECVNSNIKQLTKKKEM